MNAERGVYILAFPMNDLQENILITGRFEMDET